MLSRDTRTSRVLPVLLALLALVMAFTLVGCGGSDGDGASSGNDDDTFVVGFDQNFPPFGYVGDDGEFTGFDLEMAAEVAERNGWEVKYQPINWDAKDAELNSGNIDCIWNGFTIQGREGDYAFTKPYMDNSQVVVVRSDSGIQTLADLAGKEVLVQVDSAAEDVLAGDQAELAATFGGQTSVPDYNTAFLDMESGAADAVAMDSTIATHQITGRESEFTILDEELAQEQYGVGFKLGNEELRDKVEATLLELDADGTFEELSKKYFNGVNVSTLGQ